MISLLHRVTNIQLAALYRTSRVGRYVLPKFSKFYGAFKNESIAGFSRPFSARRDVVDMNTRERAIGSQKSFLYSISSYGTTKGWIFNRKSLPKMNEIEVPNQNFFALTINVFEKASHSCKEPMPEVSWWMLSGSSYCRFKASHSARSKVSIWSVQVPIT